MDYLDNKTVAPKWLSKEDFIFSIYTACKYEIECSEGAVGKLFYDGCRNINLTTTALKNVEWRTINFWHQVLKDISVGGRSLSLTSVLPPPSCSPFIISPVIFLMGPDIIWNDDVYIFIQLLCTFLLSQRNVSFHILLDHFFITTTKVEPGI